ncbi:MAG: chorismate synthase [Propionibacteriaceae bacterium]|nr:chorismate synthase [Propionibacteriaceae bacterium]
MLRYITAGESHGPLLTTIIEGIPAHIRVSTADLTKALARRRLGAGRGARMGFEQDSVRFTGGVIQGETIGSPISIEISNSEWPKWEQVMSADEVNSSVLSEAKRAQLLTRPRPGHADLAGMQKYDFCHARPILERASARETAARVAAGEVARQFLRQGLGIEILSHVTAIGGIHAPYAELPGPSDREAIDADPVRCLDPATSTKIQELIHATKNQGDTLGGVVEVLVWGCPPGVGTHVSAEARLDARLACALMGVQAIKGVEVGDGFALADSPGSKAHDPMDTHEGRIVRSANRAGGIEGGMSNGEVIRLRAAMKPIATLSKALPTVNIATGEVEPAHHQRSDVCAVPAAGVIAEAVVAIEVARSCLEKFGGDTLGDVRSAVDHYRTRVKEAGMEASW